MATAATTASSSTGERRGLDRAFRETLRRAQQWPFIGLRPYLAHRIVREVASPRDLDEWVRFVFNFGFSLGPHAPYGLHFSLGPYQKVGEISRFLRMVAAERPRRLLEVGSAGGGTLFLFARAAAPDALIIGMDLPRSASGVGLPAWRAALFEAAFAATGQRVRVLRGDSHSEASVARVRALLDGEPLDFLFVDADHSYDGVRRDFELYTPLVRPGGLIALHDIHPDSFQTRGVRTEVDSGDVPRFWDELKRHAPAGREFLEIIEDPGQNGCGIGVLRA